MDEAAKECVGEDIDKVMFEKGLEDAETGSESGARETKYLSIINRKGKKQIQKLASAIGLCTSVQDEAIRIFEKAEEKRINYNKRVNSKVAATLVFACQSEGKFTKKDEIAKTSGVSMKEINKCLAQLKENFQD